MPKKLFCVLLFVAFASFLPINAAEPTGSDLEGFSRSVKAAEKAAAESAQLLEEQVRFSACSCEQPKEDLEKFLNAKGLKANDCLVCHLQARSV